MKTEQQGFRAASRQSCVRPSPLHQKDTGPGWALGQAALQVTWWVTYTEGIFLLRHRKQRTPFSETWLELTVYGGKQIQTKNKKMFSQDKWCYRRPLSRSLWQSLWSRPEVLTGSRGWVDPGRGGVDWEEAYHVQGRSDPPWSWDPIGADQVARFLSCGRRDATERQRKRKEFSVSSSCQIYGGQNSQPWVTCKTPSQKLPL